MSMPFDKMSIGLFLVYNKTGWINYVSDMLIVTVQYKSVRDQRLNVKQILS